MTLSMTAGPEIQVNTDTNGNQFHPQIAQLANGDFIVVWSDSSGDGGDSGGYAAMAQLLDPNGNKIGGEFQLNINLTGDQGEPQVTALSTGGFAVTWSDSNADPSGMDIIARIYTDAGAPVTGEIFVNNLTAGHQWGPSITALGDGRFLITWQDDTADGSGYAAEGQLFDSAGNKIGGEFQINQTTLGYENAAQAVPLAGGGFVIVWNEESWTGSDPSYYGVKARIYDANGNPTTNEFLVNTTIANSQGSPFVAALANGGFVVTWMDDSGVTDHSGQGVMAQVFDGSGSKVGGEFLVNTNTAGDQAPTSIISLPSGGFVIAWNDSAGDADGYASKAQIFDSDGNKVGGEILLNQTTAGAQAWPDLIATASGFAAVWNGGTNAWDNAQEHGIFFRSFAAGTADTTPPDAPTALADSAIHNGYVNAANDTAGHALSGNAEAGSTVTVYDGTDVLGTTTVAGDGSWSFTLGTLADGSHSLTATATDAANNVSGASASLDFIVDTAAPGVPGSLSYDDTSGTLSGMAEAGASVSILDSGTLVGMATAASDGNWSFEVDPSLAHNLIATATDAAGNTSGQSDHVFTGTSGDDSVGGTQGDDLMYGADGNDLLIGRAGNDTLYGGNGDDLIYGRAGDDNLYGGAGDDFFRGEGGNDYVDGGAGFDRISYYTSPNGVTVSLLQQGTPQDTGNGVDTLVNIEAVSGSPFDDTLIGDDNDNLLNAGAQGLDSHTPTTDTLIGNGGNDLLEVVTGTETVDGGTGTDTLGFNFGPQSVWGGVTVSLDLQGAAQDTGQGSMTISNIENLSGSVFDDNLTGDSGDNVVAGGAGSDVVHGGAGNDTLLGDGEIAMVSVTGGSGPIETLQSEDFAAPDFYDVSGSIVYTFEGQDLFDANGNQLARSDLTDSNGNAYSEFILNGTTYDFAIGDATPSDGVVGNDILDGGDGNDTLIGGGGNDTLIGGAGSDSIDGGTGIDTVDYSASAGPVDLNLQAGFADEYDASGTTIVSTDTLANIEDVIGSSYSDALVGSSGDNYIDGLGGNDLIRGGGGNDQIFGGDGNDNISGDFGIGVLTGGGDDNLDGGAGNDTVRGRDGNDIVRGGDGNDFVEGGTGDDLIDGDAGIDRAAFYSMATTGVHVDLNLQGVAQDTNQGMDTLINIEDVSGTQFSDTLIGDDNDNWLWGNSRANPTDVNNDTLDGGGGNDLLMAAGGNHSLTGGSGVDTVAYTENGAAPEVNLTISLDLQGRAQATGAGNWTINSVENLSGGIADDHLTGDGNDNVLAGNAGDDNLVGGAGNDTLYGDGAIGIDYGGGPGTAGPITTFADVATTDPTLVDGNDTLVGGAGDDTLYGGGGNDTLDGTEGNDTLVGGAGDDTLYGNGTSTVAVYSGPRSQYVFTENTDGSVTVTDTTGADGTDTLWNVTQLQFNDGDVFYGTSGDDSLVGTPGDDIMYGRDGNDLMVGLAGNDTMYGEAGDDQLVGRLGNDTLYGGDGNDFFRGDGIGIGASTAGDDYIDGGAGFDRVAYYNYENGVTVSLLLQGTPQDTGQGWDTLVNIEAVSGTPFNDTLIGDDGDNWLRGSSAGLDGRTLTSDTLIGNGGNDLLEVTMGNHNVDGGAGTDTLSFGAASSNLSGGLTVLLTSQGTAQNTGQGSMTINGIENLSGSAFSDVFAGDSGNNVLAGAAGGDFLFGGAGNDLLLGDGEIGILYGAANSGSGQIHTFLSQDYSGVDFYDASGSIVYLFQGQDLYDSAGNLLARTDLVDEDGNSYSHFVMNGVGYDFYANSSDNGDTGSDGLPGNDVLAGGDGDDTLIGGAGADSLYGGAGHDTFTYLMLTDSKVGAADMINDFDEKSDFLDFTAIDANVNVAGHQDFTYVKAFTGAGGEIMANYDSKTKITHLYFDVNGDKVADMELDMSGNHTNLSQLAGATVHGPSLLATAALAGPDPMELQPGYVPDHVSLI